jgi:hypothetical protein
MPALAFRWTPVHGGDGRRPAIWKTPFPLRCPFQATLAPDSLTRPQKISIPPAHLHLVPLLNRKVHPSQRPRHRPLRQLSLLHLSQSLLIHSPLKSPSDCPCPAKKVSFTVPSTKASRSTSSVSPPAKKCVAPTPAKSSWSRKPSRSSHLSNHCYRLARREISWFFWRNRWKDGRCSDAEAARRAPKPSTWARS